MKFSRRDLIGVGLTGIAASALPACAAPAEAASEKGLLAPTPPMGWNSWNSFGTSLDEAQARETARVMADRLLPFGYDVFTIDIQWYEATASGYGYSPAPEPAMDGHGRLVPAVNRFPSAAGGRGFSALAGDVHGMGLKFGIHLMRGIPRLAVERNLPILDTGYRAADVADTSSICPWNPDMYGVDMSKPGAQAYYDSVFALYASWGVDFIKMDDMSRPYDAHAPEVEAAHRAIVRTGRPMVLSLSPGETPVIRGEHVRQHAQMWRISDDFWDDWKMLEAQFTRLENWNPWRRPGAWPDPDMLPLGRLALGARDTRFTADEQRTLMTLWSITRSPLIMGGDLRRLDEPTLALLTNPEVLAVDQASSDNSPHFVEDGVRIWSARPDDGKGRYVALFNPSDQAREVSIALRDLGLGGIREVRDLWTRRPRAAASGRFAQVIPPHGAGLYRLG
jgi:alpha-galactosidase